MAYGFFLILNAVLLIRPEELIPGIAGLRLYLIVMGLCLVTAGPRVIDTLQPDRLAQNPVTACVLGFWAAGMVSQFARGQLAPGMEFGAEFGKVVLYFMLLVSVIDTPARFRSFLGWLVVFVCVIATLGLLQYHGAVDIPALAPLERKEYAEAGDVTVILQLCSTGIYNDPNDLCLILVTGSICALARAVTSDSPPARAAWLLPIGLFGYAVVLTQSRGGLLGLVVAVATWAWGRFGWKKGLPLAAVTAPALLLLGGGRQANMNLGKEDTAHARVELWSDGLVAMMRNPVTGIGVGEYADEVGQVAHNSFVHAYVELGLLGGAFFLGAFVLGVVGLQRARPADPLLARLRPFVVAILVGYAGGIFSISRDYIVPTYLVLGVVDAYLRCAYPAPPPWLAVTRRTWGRLAAIGVVGFLGLRLLTQVLFSLGG